MNICYMSSAIFCTLCNELDLNPMKCESYISFLHFVRFDGVLGNVLIHLKGKLAALTINSSLLLFKCCLSNVMLYVATCRNKVGLFSLDMLYTVERKAISSLQIILYFKFIHRDYGFICSASSEVHITFIRQIRAVLFYYEI